MSARCAHATSRREQGHKKKLKWFTTFGPVEIEEQRWRCSRRGVRLRPFCQSARVQHRSYSRRLQRVVTDFGAESSFARAALRVREHYGIDVPVSAAHTHTLRHARTITGTSVPGAPPAAQLVTQMDGSMIPIVTPGAGEDARRGKQLAWCEARLCCARDQNSAHALYGATLGSVKVAAEVWLATAHAAGLHEQTRVHGVGDGAPWILTQFEEHFGQQGDYLIDFFHVSEYVGAAAHGVARADRQQDWRRRQQARLLENKVAGVLRSLEKHLEPPGQPEAPVRAAWRYLQERRAHLDYAGARQRKLPIGSGEVEGGHRHVVQARLKLSGCWWREQSAQAMLQLRVARANNLWDRYWSAAAQN